MCMARKGAKTERSVSADLPYSTPEPLEEKTIFADSASVQTQCLSADSTPLSTLTNMFSFWIAKASSLAWLLNLYIGSHCSALSNQKCSELGPGQREH